MRTLGFSVGHDKGAVIIENGKVVIGITQERLSRIKHDGAFSEWEIPLSSINYWRNPQNGVRRNIDITCVCHIFIYQNYLIYNGLTSLPYYCFMGIGLFYYFLSNWCITSFPKISSYSHCCFHLFCNLASLSLIMQF